MCDQQSTYKLSMDIEKSYLNGNKLSPTVLPDRGVAALARYFQRGIDIARSLVSAQFADLLQRINGIGTIRSYTLWEDNKFVKGSQPQPEYGVAPSIPSVVPSPFNYDQSYLAGNILQSNDVQNIDLNNGLQTDMLQYIDAQNNAFLTDTSLNCFYQDDDGVQSNTLQYIDAQNNAFLNDMLLNYCDQDDDCLQNGGFQCNNLNNDHSNAHLNYYYRNDEFNSLQLTRVGSQSDLSNYQYSGCDGRRDQAASTRSLETSSPAEGLAGDHTSNPAEGATIRPELVMNASKTAQGATPTSPGFGNSVSCYPTPPADSPQKKRRRIQSTSPLLGCHDRESRGMPSSDLGRNPVETGSSATTSNTICLLLKSCKFGRKDKKGKKVKNDGNNGNAENDGNDGKGKSLDDGSLQQVLAVGAFFISRDSCLMLRSRLDSWRRNVSQGVHALGLPTPWVGIEAAARYLELIEFEDTDTITKNVARMLYSLNYEELFKHPEKYCPRPRQKREKTRTWVIDCIASYFHKPNHETQKSRRDFISGQARWGRWIWSLVGTVGYVLILTCDDTMISRMMNDSFSIAQIDALATYALHTRPGTIRLLHSLDSAVRELIFGRVSTDLAVAIQGDGTSPFGSEKLSRINNEDETALARQHLDSRWDPIDSESVAYKEMDKILNDNTMRQRLGI